MSGATGAVGGRVARLLAERGVRQRLVVRDPARAPALPDSEVVVGSYAEADAMRLALHGVTTFLLVSGAESADRVAQHKAAIDAAVAAGVERVVYTSFLAPAPDASFTLARDHWHTEEHLRGSGLAWTMLRDSLYLDMLPLFAAGGVLRGPGGDGRVGAVARDDVADVAAAVLLDDGHAGQAYALTGPESLSLSEVAERITAASGRPVRYETETVEEAYASRARYGAPPWQVEAWVSTYTAIASGELDVVTGAVAELAGHPARSLETVLGEHPELVAAGG